MNNTKEILKLYLTRTLLGKILVLFPLFGLLPQQNVNAQTLNAASFYTLRDLYQAEIDTMLNSSDPAVVEKANGEDGKIAQLSRWNLLWRYRLGPNGDMNTAANQYNLYLQSQNQRAGCDSPNDNSVQWTNLGPFNSDGSTLSSGNCGGVQTSGTQNQGRIETISPDPTNDNNCLVGAWNGGIWRTENGGGRWKCTTDDEGFSIYGCVAMVRHPANANVIYACMKVSGGLWEGSRAVYSMGVIVSTDGGETWVPTGLSSPLVYPWSPPQVNNIAIDPRSTLADTKLYVTTYTNVYKFRGDKLAQGTWSKIFTNDFAFIDGAVVFGWIDFNEIVVEDSNDDNVLGKVWFANKFGLKSYNPTTNSVQDITNYTVPASMNAAIVCGDQHLRQDINIELNKSGDLVLAIAYLGRKSACNGTYIAGTFLYRSTNHGQTWSAPKEVPIYHNYSSLAPKFAIDRYDSEVLYAEYGGMFDRCVRKSLNFGTSFEPLGNADNHVDVRNIICTEGTARDVCGLVYVATDGGLARTGCTTETYNKFTDMTGEDLCITNFYGCGISDKTDKKIICGAQDGSINFYNYGSWYDTEPCCDNGDCLISPNDDSKFIQEANNFLVDYNNNFLSLETGFMNPLAWNPTNSSEFFVGIKHVFTVNPTTQAFFAIPNSKISDHNISSVVMSRKNPNVLYFSTDNSTIVDDGIYKATRNGSNWTVVKVNSNLQTTGSTIEGPISDIAIDPNDENRLWITLGGFNSGLKVFYSSNGGGSWQNISLTGLPNLPATAICYQELSNNRLYVGTDAGVYYKDDSQPCWSRYGNGGPQCMINDMEINLCSGKLVVATHGRGLWEAPLLIGNNAGEELVLPVAVTNWNSDKALSNHLRVPRGATLNITGATVNIAKDIRITIEPGARVNVTNSTLTNGCGYVWDGIKVWGNSNLSQTYVNQGALILNNSTIEHATDAVVVAGDGGLLYNGGIVQATLTKFLNNKRSVAYYKYDRPTNLGFFSKCEFRTTPAYKHEGTLLSHMSLWAVHGIKINGCDFETTNAWTQVGNRVKGIVTYDADFVVDHYCYFVQYPNICIDERKSTFKGLNVAIDANRTTGSSTFTVNQSVFENNIIGIKSTAHNNITLTKNYFKVGNIANNNPAIFREHEGIVVFAGTGFKIQENEFEPNFESFAPNTIGIRINGSGSENNDVYLNKFRKMTAGNQNVFYGNLANETNRNVVFPNVGLTYTCNENYNNVRNGYDIAVRDAGISYLQGTPFFPAQNVFSKGIVPAAPQGSDFHNGSYTGVIAYTYNDNNGIDPAKRPENIYQVAAFLSSSTQTTCASKLVDGRTLADVRGRYNTVLPTLVTNRGTYTTSLDGGNTASLISSIRNVSNANKAAVLSTLSTISPFVSREALQEILLKGSFFTSSELISVFSQNPDALADGTLFDDISATGLLTAAEVQTIRSNTSGIVTARTTSEQNLHDLEVTHTEVCNDALELLHQDPVAYPLDSLLPWLSRKHSKESDMEAIDLLIDNNRHSEAIALLNGIGAKFALQAVDLVEVGHFATLKHVQMNMMQNGENSSALLPSTRLSIESIANASNGLAGYQAKALLNLNGANYFVPAVYPSNEPSVAKTLVADRISNTEDREFRVQAVPNPAHEEISFKYDIKPAGNYRIVIYSESGTTIDELPIQGLQGAVQWNCTKCPKGTYFYVLQLGAKRITGAKKLILN